MDGGRPWESLRVVVRHVHAVQSTIQWETGAAVVKIGLGLGRPFRAHQKAAYGVIAHPIRVKWDRRYSTISTVCKCESHCFSQNHSVGRFFLSVNLEQTKCLLRLIPLMHCI